MYAGNVFKITICDLKRSKFMVRRQGQKAAGFGESAAQRCGTIDSHTARPEGSAGALNQAVKRNKGRFPIDFMFRLSWDETRLVSALRSQNVILKRGGHLKFRPNAFTEHGAVMLGMRRRGSREGHCLIRRGRGESLWGELSDCRCMVDAYRYPP